MAFPSEQYYVGTRPEVATFLPQNYIRVLEIGCGEGGFRANLKSNCEYWGIEPVMSVAQIAETKLTKVLNGNYENIQDQIPDGYFDLIICNDVIEHMVSHDDFFKDICKKLSDNGHIVGSIPNVRYLPVLFSLIVNRDWQYEDCGVLDRTHLRFFTQKSLFRTLAIHNYKIEKFSGINPITTTRYRYIWPFCRKILSLLFGEDIMFTQFAFRIKYIKSE